MSSIFYHEILFQIVLERLEYFVDIYHGLFFVCEIIFVLSAYYPEQIGFVEDVQLANIKFIIDFLEHVLPKYLVALFRIVLLQNTQALQNPDEGSLIHLLSQIH